MKFRPRVDRVIVEPLKKPSDTASGLAVVRDWEPEVMGTVVAVGRMSHPLREDAHRCADDLTAVIEEHGADPSLVEAQRLLRALVVRTPVCRVGDTVLFSWTTGQEIQDHDADTRYLVLKEDDIFAVLEKDPA